MFPTFQVNLSLLPIYYILSTDTGDVSWLLYCASIFTILAVSLETIADRQMREFTSIPSNHRATMRTGFWKFSRHPNYLGEVSFRFGLYIFAVASGSTYIWLLVCPMVMLGLFVFISCPMMDNRSLKKRSDYKEYMDKTPQLIMWFVRD